MADFLPDDGEVVFLTTEAATLLQICLARLRWTLPKRKEKAFELSRTPEHDCRIVHGRQRPVLVTGCK